jgi:hypothetical protein
MWQKGPLPPNTYMWGGVVPTDHKGSGFFFADFCGDHVKIHSSSSELNDRVISADEVAWYNNCLDLPPEN